MVSKPVSIAALLQNGRERLAADRHNENCANEAYYLLNKLTGIRREQLALRGGEMVDPLLGGQYDALVTRRLKGEPLQYLLGEWEFYGLPMRVGSGVLIPRPETEELVKRVLAFVEPIKAPVLLDLCSGSGCIPIALAHCRPDATVWGVELSAAAYGYFCENTGLNGSKNVTPVMSDIFALPAAVTGRRYHAITANPPYIATSAMDDLQREVHHEPLLALDGGNDGLDFYHRLPAIAKALLLDGGLLAMEIGEEQGQAVASLMTAAGFAEVAVHRDIFGNDRIVTGSAPV